MLSTYMGFALGTISSGSLGDYAGRRLPVFVAYLGMCCSVGGAKTLICLCLAPWGGLVAFS